MASETQNYQDETAIPLPGQANPNYSSTLLSSAARANTDPNSDPYITTKVALASASPADAATNTVATNALLQSGQTAQNLSEQSEQVQEAVWDSLTPAHQRLLKSAGYTPLANQQVKQAAQQEAQPTQSHSKVMGLLGDLPGAKTIENDVIHPAEHVIGDVVHAKPVNMALNAVSAPGRFITKLARTGYLETTKNEAGSPDSIFSTHNSQYSNSLGALFNPHTWAKSWKEASEGQKFIYPSVEKEVQREYGSEIYGYARQVAMGDTVEQVVKALPANKQAGALKVLQSERGQKAVAALQDGHFTVGQAIVGASNLQSHPWTHNLSGAIDAVWDWQSDPLNSGTKLLHGLADGSHIAFSGTQIADQAASNPAIERALGRIADTVSSGDSHTFVKNYSNLQAIYPDLRQAAIAAQASGESFGATGVAKTMQDILNAGRMGDLPNAMIPGLDDGGVLMPKLTRAGMVREAVTDQLKKPLNFIANPDRAQAYVKGVKASELTMATTSPVAHTAGMMHPLINLSDKLGTAWRKLSTYVPQAINHGELDMGNAASRSHFLEQLYNTASLSLPRARARTLVDALAENMQAEPGKLKNLYTQFVKEIGLAAGMTPGSEELKKLMGGIDSSMRDGYEDGTGALDGQMYGSGSTSHMEGPSGRDTAALYESQMAMPRFNLPDAKLVLQAQRKGLSGKIMNFIDGTTGPLMNVWRPAVLMRPAFGTRVAADEGLIGMLRMGPKEFLRSRILSSAQAAASKLAPMDVEDLENDGLLKRWFGDFTDNELQDLREQYQRPVHKFDEMPKDFQRQQIRDLRDWGNENPNKILEGFDTPISEMSDGQLRQIARSQMGESASGISQAWYRQQYRRLIAKVGGAIASDKEMAAMKAYTKYMGHNAFLKYVATEEGSAGYLGAAVSTRRAEGIIGTGRDHKLVPAELQPTGAYRQLTPGDYMFNKSLQKAYHNISRSEWGRVAASTGDRDAVADAIQDSDVWKNMAVRAHRLSTGERVDLGEATTREAALDHADKVIQDVKNMTTSHTGEDLPEIRSMLAAGDAPSAERIRQMADDDHLPRDAYGPEMVHVLDVSKPNVFKRLSDATWNKTVVPQVNWMVRQPIYMHEFMKAWDATDGLMRRAAEDAGGSDQALENWELNHYRASMQHAVNNVLPYVHNPELKSQFALLTRNIMPFYFAQQQFFRRWGLSILAAPWSAHQLQLVNGGIQHNGFVHQETDANGQTENYFVYPGSQFVQGEVGRVVGLLTGSGSLPVTGQLTGSPNSLIAGQTIEAPSGPLTSIGLKLLEKLDPALAGFSNKLQGQAGASENYLESILPSDVYRMMEAYAPQTFDSAGYASAQMQAIQYLEATGHGLATPALNNKGMLTGDTTPEQFFTDHSGLTPGDYVTNDKGEEFVYTDQGHWQQTTAANEAKQMQVYIQRVNAWTKSFLGMRAAFGLIAPASPQMQIGGQVGQNGLYNEFLQYTNSMPFDQALAAFVKAHPDAQAYEVFNSNNQGASGEYNNQDAQNWINQNKTFLNAHNEAGLYFLPMSDVTSSTNPYSATVQKQQVSMDMRTKESESTYWQQIAYDAAAQPFYNAEDAMYKELDAHTGDSNAQSQIYADWDQFQQSYLAANPLFAQQYQEKTGPSDRLQLMTDVGNALKDPNVPRTQQTDDISTLYNAWQQWQTMLHGPGGDGVNAATSAEKTQIDTDFANWAYQFQVDHPDVAMLYNKAIRPDLSSVLNPANDIPVDMTTAQNVAPTATQPTNG